MLRLVKGIQLTEREAKAQGQALARAKVSALLGALIIGCNRPWCTDCSRLECQQVRNEARSILGILGSGIADMDLDFED